MARGLSATLIRKHHGNLKKAWAEKRRRRNPRSRQPLYRVRKGYKGKKRSRRKRKPLRGGMWTGQRRLKARGASKIRNPRRRRNRRRRLPPRSRSGRFMKRRYSRRRRNPRRRRNTYRSRRRNPRRVRSRRYYNRRRRNVRRRRNPTTVKGILRQTWKDLTSMSSIKQYLAAGGGMLVANVGGKYMIQKVREMSDQTEPGSALAKLNTEGGVNWIGVAAEAAAKIAVTSVATIVVPSRYRASFMIGGAAGAMWEPLKLALLSFAPDFSASIGLDGWLTNDELAQLGLSGWMSKGTTQRMLPRTHNPQFVRLPGASHQFSGA